MSTHLNTNTYIYGGRERGERDLKGVIESGILAKLLDTPLKLNFFDDITLSNIII